jgi:hypothetical protein
MFSGIFRVKSLQEKSVEKIPAGVSLEAHDAVKASRRDQAVSVG